MQQDTLCQQREIGLVEVAFVDTTSTPLRHEHHLAIRTHHDQPWKETER